MRQGVDHGVVAGAGLSEQGRQHGLQGRNDVLVAPHALDNDGAVGCPADEPDGDVHDSRLGHAHLRALCVTAAGAKVGYIHLLGLCPHSRLVGNHSAYDVHVAVQDSA